MSDMHDLNLDVLIASAVEDPSLEDALFARLLETTLYVHSPKLRTGANLSLVQFRTPQGVLAIPVFTDRNKSEFAGRGNVRTVSIRGRTLLEATQGAAIVINPNDAWCILYPEEIQILLRGGQLGRSPERLDKSDVPELHPATDANPQFVHAVVASLASSNHALDAWLTAAGPTDAGGPARYVIVIGAEKAHHERIARKLTMELADTFKSLDKIVDIAFVEPGENHTMWRRNNADCLIYSRALTPSLNCGLHGNA